MTLQQLRYVTAVAGTGTISHAVQRFSYSLCGKVGGQHKTDGVLFLECACYPYSFPTIFPRAAAGRSLHKRLRNLYCAPAT